MAQLAEDLPVAVVGRIAVTLFQVLPCIGIKISNKSASGIYVIAIPYTITVEIQGPKSLSGRKIRARCKYSVLAMEALYCEPLGKVYGRRLLGKVGVQDLCRHSLSSQRRLQGAIINDCGNHVMKIQTSLYLKSPTQLLGNLFVLTTKWVGEN
jgi:hypothetical protein